MQPVDLVYLWVNGNDPEWIAKRNALIGEASNSQVNCKGRFVDNGELKYSLRSVEKYVPWVNRIFIVTDHQVPEWLDVSNPKVRVVDHTEIMPAESLPCFNSAVIEMFMDKIPGLSEHFIYANDDMFVNRPVTPQDFFAEDGNPYICLRRKRFRKLMYFYKEKILGKKLNAHLQTIRNSTLLVEEKYGKYYSDKMHHNIDAYRKSTFTMTNDAFADAMRATWTHHMRSPRDIERCIYSFTALAEGRGHLRYVDHNFSLQLQIDERDLYDEFEKRQPKLFCMNDGEHASDDDREYAVKFLNRLFPEKSQFEK